MAAKAEVLSLWVVYRHPKDFPGSYVARRFELNEPTEDIVVGGSLADVRRLLRAKGLACLQRDPKDDPVIVETWL